MIEIIDFKAEWCGPCKMLEPILHNFSVENPNIIMKEVDVDANPEIAEAYKIMSVPTLVYLINGVEVSRSIGFISKSLLEEKVGKWVDANS